MDKVKEKGLPETVWPKWREFVGWRRRQLKKKITERGASGLLNRLLTIDTPELMIACIDNSMDNDWQGLFPEREPTGRKRL